MLTREHDKQRSFCLLFMSHVVDIMSSYWCKVKRKIRFDELGVIRGKAKFVRIFAIHSHAGVWGMQLSALFGEGRLLSGHVREIVKYSIYIMPCWR